MAVIMGMILPGILLNWAVEEPVEESLPPETEFRPIAPVKQPQVKLTMLLRQGETVTEMDMDAYLVGVLLAELPSTFEDDAKKAQAVVARTFARKAAVTGGKHGDGSVCADSGCCQAYIPAAEYLEKGGSQEAIREAQAAVEATSGYVLTYEGQLIEATYFSCSGGQTEDAVAVWGTDFPYLRSVESPGEEYAAHYTDTVEFSRSELEDRLELTLNGTPESWVGDISYTAGGGVACITIGGREFKGTEIRSKLGLRSTAFSITAGENGVAIVTRGFGHRVGMSQYGADAMAASGKSYVQILSYYYPGTILELTNGAG